MVAIDEKTITGVALEQMSATPNPRLPKLPSIRFDFQLGTAATREESGRVGADPSRIVKRPALGSH